MKFRMVLPFAAGLGVGIFLTVLTACGVSRTSAATSQSASPASVATSRSASPAALSQSASSGAVAMSHPAASVAAGHPAAQLAVEPSSSSVSASVARMEKSGIVAPYSDGKFHGNAPVTRYEMAVVLDRFVRYIEAAHKPLKTTSAPVNNSMVSAPAGHWAHSAQVDLVKNKFLPANSVLLKAPGTALVTADQFTDSLSYAVSRLSDRSMPPTPNADTVD